MNGVLALNWSRLSFDADDFARNFDQHLTQPIRNMAAHSIDVSSIVAGVFSGVSKKVAEHYNQFLFHHAKLKDLPDAPRFVFNATSLQTGVLWRFSKPYMGDYMVGLVRNPDLELATAVAASSAFPPVLSPVVLSLDPASFDPTIMPPAQVTADEFREKVVLADGGVYDNLGLETAWKHNKTVLVSDAGGALLNQCDPAQDWLGQVDRILNVTYRQVVTLRKRSVIQLFKLGVRDGAYWGIGSDIASYQLPDALSCPPDVTAELAATPTRLTSTADPLQEQLIDWGYAVCDAGMRRWVVKDASPPAQSPYATFKKS